MFKVMIVDDEIFIISLIEKLIDWEKYGMCIAGTADNGMTALEEVKRLQPDIIIVDVRMPGYDGITFMQKVRELNDKVKFVVISGHKKFEYAKSAMQYNVEDYLLKPVSKNELEQILQKLGTKLESEKQNEAVLKKLDNQLGVSKGKLRSYFFERILNGSLNIPPEDLAAVNQTFFTTFSLGIFQVICVKLDAAESIPDKNFTDTLIGRVQELMADGLAGCCFECLVKSEQNSITMLLNYQANQREEVWKKLRDNFKGIQEVLVKFEQLYITMGMGREVTGLSGFSESYGSAEKCLYTRTALEIGAIIQDSMVKEDPGIIDIIFSDEARVRLAESFKSFQVDKIKLQVLGAFSAGDEYRYRDTCIYHEILQFIHRKFYEYLRQIDIYKGSYEDLEVQLMEKLLWCYTPRQTAAALMDQISIFIEEYTQNSKGGENPSIRIAKKYIAENYARNISMASVAEVVNLSGVYFSVLFKKEVGTNFVDYLNQYRIDMAKKLLKDVRYNVNEVAGLVGFSDARYFSKMFKKNVGVKPTEYRSRNVT